MTDRPDFLTLGTAARCCAISAAARLGVGAALAASRAQAQDQMLQLLMEQTRRSDFGQTYDSGIRSVRMPKSSLPTLSPADRPDHRSRDPALRTMVAQGGWQTVPPNERMRLGNRSKAVIALRQRLIAGGDLATSAGVSDVFDSYVEAGVKRFQARHGLTVDGMVREATLAAMNVPAEVRLAQLKTNLTRLRAFPAISGLNS